MSDRPLEDYSLPYLWNRIAELEAELVDLNASHAARLSLLRAFENFGLAIDELRAALAGDKL